MPDDAFDLGLAARVEAVHERNADVDFGGLAVGVSRCGPLARGFETAHPLPGSALRSNVTRGFASTRRRTQPPDHRFQIGRPSRRAARRMSLQAIAAAQSSFQRRPFLRMGMMAVPPPHYPQGAVLAHLEHVGSGLLCRCAERGDPEVWATRDHEHGSGQPVHVLCLGRLSSPLRPAPINGWQGPVPR